jgi:hypothetical protein
MGNQRAFRHVFDGEIGKKRSIGLQQLRKVQISVWYSFTDETLDRIVIVCKTAGFFRAKKSAELVGNLRPL